MTAIVMPITAPDGYSSDYDLQDAMNYMDETPSSAIDAFFVDIDAKECLFTNAGMPPPPKRQKVQVEKTDFVFPGLDYISQMQERIANIKVVPNMGICILNPLQRLEKTFEAIIPSELNMVDRMYSFKKSFVLNVVHDNNDQFRAVAKFMFEDESRYEEVKRQALGDIQQRPQVYNADTEYVENVKSSIVGGNHLTLYAIAYRYRRRIEIVTDHKDHEGSLIEIDTEKTLDDQRPIVLVYLKSKNRYSAAVSFEREGVCKNPTEYTQTLNALNNALEVSKKAAQDVTDVVNNVKASIKTFDGDVVNQPDTYWDKLLLTNVKDDPENITEIVRCADFFGLISLDNSDTESCASFASEQKYYTNMLEDDCVDTLEETGIKTRSQQKKRDEVQEQLLKRYNKPEKMRIKTKWHNVDRDYVVKKSGEIVDWVNRQEYRQTSMVRLSLEPTGRDCTAMAKEEYLQLFAHKREYLEQTIKRHFKVIPKMKFERAHFYNWKEDTLTMYVEKRHIEMFTEKEGGQKRTWRNGRRYSNQNVVLIINKQTFLFKYKKRSEIEKEYGKRSTVEKRRVKDGYFVDMPYSMIENGQFAIVAPNEKTILITLTQGWSVTIRTDGPEKYEVLHVDGFDKFYEALEFHDYYMVCIIEKKKIRKNIKK